MDSEENTPRRENGPDPLDDLLKAAAWPEPEPGRVERLRQQWHATSPVRAPKRRLARAAAWAALAAGLAATLAVVIALGRFLPRPAGVPHQTAPSHGRAERLPVPDKPGDSILAHDVPEVRPRAFDFPAGSREATPYEEFVFRSITRKRPPAADAPEDGLIERAIDARLDGSEADLNELARPLLAARQTHERALAWRIQESGGPRLVAAIELLGYVGSRRSAPLLIELSRREATHAPAVRALARLADPQTLGQLAVYETDARLQQALAASLIARRDRRSVAVYLALVSARSTREAAMAALEGVADPPVDLLFEFFDARQQKQRHAAAVVLGRLNDPEIPQRLIRMVAGDVQPREALVALAASSHPEALQFVALAQRDPVWTGSVRAARLQVNALSP